MRSELFLPTAEGEVRLLLLIHAFSGSSKGLEGRTKLAKLDFFVRYPTYFERAVAIRDKAPVPQAQAPTDIETRMVRFRYGPWDPAYFALIGRLVGRGLITTVPIRTGTAYRTTEAGARLAQEVASTTAWGEVAERIKVLRSKFNLTGTTLKNFIYDHFPEVASASWGDLL
jgi:hypothetical protein